MPVVRFLGDESLTPAGKPCAPARTNEISKPALDSSQRRKGLRLTGGLRYATREKKQKRRKTKTKERGRSRVSLSDGLSPRNVRDLQNTARTRSGDRRTHVFPLRLCVRGTPFGAIGTAPRWILDRLIVVARPIRGRVRLPIGERSARIVNIFQIV